MDGWGGALAARIKDTVAALPGWTPRPVGSGLEKRREFEVRAAGAELDDESEDPATFDSSIILTREAATVTACVAESETDTPVSLYPAVRATVNAVQQHGWLDPSVAFIEPTYPDRSEGSLPVTAGFAITARVQRPY